MKKLILVAVLGLCVTPSDIFAACSGASQGMTGARITGYSIFQNGNIHVTFGAFPGKPVVNAPASNSAILPVNGCTSYGDANCSQRLAQLSAVQQFWQLGNQVTVVWCASGTPGIGSEIINVGNAPQ